MSGQTIADLIIATLKNAGVQRVYGVVGDSLNGITNAIQQDGGVEWIHVRHEEAAAFAACGEAQITGKLAVCAGSCGPGNLHLINGLFDAHRTRVPVLAIAAQIPSADIGSGYFQETHPEQLFRECSHFCEIVSSPGQMPRMLDSAIRSAVKLQARWGEMTLYTSDGAAFVEVEPAGIDISRVAAVEALVDAVCAGVLNSAGAFERLDAIGRAPAVS